jgi:hypothetical protein
VKTLLVGGAASLSSDQRVRTVLGTVKQIPARRRHRPLLPLSNLTGGMWTRRSSLSQKSCISAYRRQVKRSARQLRGFDALCYSRVVIGFMGVPVHLSVCAGV